MNIIEAVKSGLPYKRKSHSCWFDKTNHWRGDDILADDWEVQEQTVTITKRELREAYCKADSASIGLGSLYSALEKELFK